MHRGQLNTVERTFSLVHHAVERRSGVPPLWTFSLVHHAVAAVQNSCRVSCVAHMPDCTVFKLVPGQLARAPDLFASDDCSVLSPARPIMPPVLARAMIIEHFSLVHPARLVNHLMQPVLASGSQFVPDVSPIHVCIPHLV